MYTNVFNMYTNVFNMYTQGRGVSWYVLKYMKSMQWEERMWAMDQPDWDWGEIHIAPQYGSSLATPHPVAPLTDPPPLLGGA